MVTRLTARQNLFIGLAPVRQIFGDGLAAQARSGEQTEKRASVRPPQWPFFYLAGQRFSFILWSGGHTAPHLVVAKVTPMCYDDEANQQSFHIEHGHSCQG